MSFSSRCTGRWTLQQDQPNYRHRHCRKQSLLYPILLLASTLAVSIAAAAQLQQQQLPASSGYTRRDDPTGDEKHQPETTKNGTASGGGGETFWTDDESSRLPDMTVVKSRPEVVASRAATERPPQWRGGGQLLLQRGGRQAPASMEPSSSSSRIVHGDVGTMLLDAKYPLAGFDDVDFEEAGGGIGPISLGGDLDEAEIQRRRGLHSASTAAAPTVDESESDAAFSGALETNVTASLGQTAFLRCRLKNSQHQVTWIRIRDWHILTSGLLTYTADARFRVKHATEASEWTLEIKFLQKRDEGTYYCQIPTRTGAVVHAFHLHVASPQAVILGGQVSHVDILTPSLTLVCIVDNTPDPPQVIFWYHNGTLLKDGKYPEVGGAGLISSHLTLTPSRTMSMLTLQHIQHIHSGNYTCRAPNAESDTTQLFVTQRHEQAAVHRSSSSGRNVPPPAIVLIIAALVGHVLTVRRKFLHQLCR